jgi:hypothetical protein
VYRRAYRCNSRSAYRLGYRLIPAAAPPVASRSSLCLPKHGLPAKTAAYLSSFCAPLPLYTKQVTRFTPGSTQRTGVRLIETGTVPNSASHLSHNVSQCHTNDNECVFAFAPHYQIAGACLQSPQSDSGKPQKPPVIERQPECQPEHPYAANRSLRETALEVRRGHDRLSTCQPLYFFLRPCVDQAGNLGLAVECLPFL